MSEVIKNQILLLEGKIHTQGVIIADFETKEKNWRKEHSKLKREIRDLGDRSELVVDISKDLLRAAVEQVMASATSDNW